MVDKMSHQPEMRQLLDFAKQVLHADSKIRKRAIQHLKSEDSVSIGMVTADQRIGSKSAFDVQLNALGYSDFDAADQGTPITKGLANELSLYEETQMRRQTESPFNSPFQELGNKGRMNNIMVEEHAISQL